MRDINDCLTGIARRVQYINKRKLDSFLTFSLLLLSIGDVLDTRKKHANQKENIEVVILTSAVSMQV